MTHSDEARAIFTEQRRVAVRYERFLLVKGVAVLLLVVVVAFVHQFLAGD